MDKADRHAAVLKAVAIDNARMDLFDGRTLYGIVNLLRSEYDIPQDVRNALADMLDVGGDSTFRLTDIKLRKHKHYAQTQNGKLSRADRDRDLVYMMKVAGASKRGHRDRAIYEVFHKLAVARNRPLDESVAELSNDIYLALSDLGVNEFYEEMPQPAPIKIGQLEKIWRHRSDEEE